MDHSDDCVHKLDWERVNRALKTFERIAKYFEDNGEFGLQTKVRLLWNDRTSRNRITENITTWAFRAALIWLIWNKTP